MLRTDCHRSQGKDFIRTEIEGEPLEIIEKERTTLWRKKERPTACVVWLGRHMVRWGGETFVAEGSMTADAGPRIGCSVVVHRAPEVPYTEEEKAAGREHIRRVASHIYFGTPL